MIKNVKIIVNENPIMRKVDEFITITHNEKDNTYNFTSINQDPQVMIQLTELIQKITVNMVDSHTKKPALDLV